MRGKIHYHCDSWEVSRNISSPPQCHFCKTVPLLFLAAPSPPQDLNVTVLGPTQIFVMWLEPEFPNGIIRNYTLSVTDLEAGITTNYSVDGSEQSTVITGLDPYTLYSVTVRGITVVAGDPSLSVMERTDESSEYLSFFEHSILNEI